MAGVTSVYLFGGRDMGDGQVKGAKAKDSCVDTSVIAATERLVPATEMQNTMQNAVPVKINEEINEEVRTAGGHEIREIKSLTIADVGYLILTNPNNYMECASVFAHQYTAVVDANNNGKMDAGEDSQVFITLHTNTSSISGPQFLEIDVTPADATVGNSLYYFARRTYR